MANPTQSAPAESAKFNKPWISKKRKLTQPSKSIPPFRWCFDNDTLDQQISDELSCEFLFDKNGMPEVEENAKKWTSPCEYTDAQIADMAAENCSHFLRNFNFLDDSVSELPTAQEESKFPLAFVMVVEKWSSQVIRLLSSVYRSHNLYCLTFDLHASRDFKRAMIETARCLNSSVITPKEHLEIYWADISLLQATLNCLKVMAKSDHDWRYVQILSYNDFPLKTNKEMVQILRLFNGANDVELAQGQPERYAHYHKLSELDNDRLNDTRPVPPAGIIIYKGSFAATLSREFIRFVFDDVQAKQFLEWSVPTWAPEEQFWSTLVHNEHLNAPGRFPGSCLEYYRHGSLDKLWISRWQVWYTGCQGTYTSGSCVFGVGDLPNLIKRPELIAHKFYSDFEPAALYCMAKRHYERTYAKRDNWEYPDVPLDMEHYSTLPAVQYQRMHDKEKFNCAITYTRTQN